MHAELIIDAIRMAACNYRLQSGAIFHTIEARSILAKRSPRSLISSTFLIQWGG